MCEHHGSGPCPGEIPSGVLARPPDLDLRPADARGLGRRSFLVLLAGAGGSLTVGCTAEQLGSMNLVSDQELMRMSARTWQQTLRESRVSRDEAANRRVREISGRLIRASAHSGPQRQWTTAVIDDPTPNAFALPGGQIGVHTGILRLAEDDDQLATVIGHEIAHVHAEHGRQRVNAQAATQLGTNILGLALGVGGVAGGDTIAGLLGAGVNYGVILPFSRENELEADRLGLMYMADAGYDPYAAVEFWTRMSEAANRAGGGKPPEWMSTHPSDERRIAQLETFARLEGARIGRPARKS